MAFFEMHIKSDELDCIPDVKVQGKMDKSATSICLNLYIIHKAQIIEANTRMSLK